MSAILSDPAPDTTMAFPDYQQTCADHARYDTTKEIRLKRGCRWCGFTKLASLLRNGTRKNDRLDSLERRG